MCLYLRALGLIIIYQWDGVMNHLENSSTCGLDALQSSTNAQAVRPLCLACVLGEIWEDGAPWVCGLFPEFLSCNGNGQALPNNCVKSTAEFCSPRLCDEFGSGRNCHCLQGPLKICFVDVTVLLCFLVFFSLCSSSNRSYECCWI